MKALICLLVGHRWSRWVAVWPLHVDATGTFRVHYDTNAPVGFVRMCKRGHFASIGYDWEDAPEGVTSAAGAQEFMWR